MKVLVTGAEGFVGAHLMRRLAADGHDVIPTALEGGDGIDLDAGDWIGLDVLDGEKTRAVVASVEPDIVFHMAGFSSGANARANAARALRVNAEGTLNVLEAVFAAKSSARVVVPSSADVYGDPGPDPAGEDAPVAPRSVYGVSKAAQELVALALADVHGLDVRAARLFPLVGPGQRDDFVVPAFCRQATAIAEGRAEPVMRVGNLDVERDIMDVRDGVDGLVALAGLDAPDRRTYNVCSGRGVTVRELLGWILAEAGIDPKIMVDPERVRAADPQRIVGSPERLWAEAGWRSKRDVREGVRDTYRWVGRSDALH
ncbi:MAG: NAD-dependent epimerase/dehydratase family protein [Gemmatimonadota bacterium]